MGRFVVTARLKRGSVERVREILRQGPPFDPASTSFERHHVYLGRDELLFIFEGPHADEEVGGVLNDFNVLSRASRLARYFKGSPQIAEEVFGWDRPAEIDGVTFSAQAGPGDSDGG